MIRKVFASFFLTIFVALFLPFTLLLGAFTTFFDEDFYKGKFSELAYAVTITELPRAIAEGSNAPPLTEEELRSIIQDVLTKEDFDMVMEDFFEQLDENAVTENGNVQISLNLDWLNDKNDIILARVTDEIIADLPACAPEEYDPSLSFPNCVPPIDEEAELDFRNQIEMTLDRQIFAELPDMGALEFEMPSQFSGTAADFFSETFNLSLLVIGLTLILLLLFIALLIFKPASAVWRWIFKTIAVASGFALVILALFYFMPADGLVNPDVQAYGDLYTLMLKSLALNTVIFVAPIFVVSVMLWIVMRRSEANKVLNEPQ